MKQSVYNAALKEINVLRKGFGLRPLRRIPAGLCAKPGACPVANALGIRVSVGASTYVIRGEVQDRRLPEPVARFVCEFDMHAPMDGKKYDPRVFVGKPLPRKPRK